MPSSKTYNTYSNGGFLKVAPVLCVSFFITACDPLSLALGTGTAVGAASAEDRGVSGVLSDSAIRLKINCRWLEEESALVDHVYLSVQKGVVLLTGVVETTALKQKAVDLIRSVPGIQKIVNEIRVGTPENLKDYTRDAWITAKLRTALLCDAEIASRNYSIRTVGRTVYLMGVAKDSDELERVTHHACSISGVRKVVNYTQMKPLLSPKVICPEGTGPQ